MKKVKTLYWIFTALFIAFMLATSLSQVLSAKGTEDVMNTLKMPIYLLPLLGISKLLAIVAIIISGFPKVKEWAYAGVMFDFIVAMYSMIAVGGTIDKWGFMILPILLCGLSYYFHDKLLKLKTGNSLG
jgi:uncharacterized membrane protein YphA (DoxX/SURF4 family)